MDFVPVDFVPVDFVPVDFVPVDFRWISGDVAKIHTYPASVVLSPTKEAGATEQSLASGWASVDGVDRLGNAPKDVRRLSMVNAGVTEQSPASAPASADGVGRLGIVRAKPCLKH